MRQRTKRNKFLVDLVHDYERQTDKHNFVLTEERVIDLIQFYETEEDFDKALEVVDLALRKYEYQVEFHVLKAKLLYAKKQYGESFEVVTKAQLLAPFELEPVLLGAIIGCELDIHDQVLSKLESFKESSHFDRLVKILLTEAYIFEHMKDFEKMFYSLKNTLIIDPGNVEALEKMWVSVELSKLYQESIQFHLELIDKQPYSYMAWYNLGQAYSCIGEYGLAIEALEYSFLINEEFEMAYRDCAELCMQEQDYRKALTILHDLVAHFGVESEVLVQISQCHLELEEIDKAKKILLTAVKLDPYNDEIFFYLAECFTRQGKWHYAINAYERATEIEDRREEYFIGMGKAFAKMGNWNQAQTCFARATEVGPEQNEPWLAYAEFLIGIFQFDKAFKVLEEAKENAVGTDLSYCEVVCLWLSREKEEAYDLLATCLIEDYDRHEIMFQIAPDLMHDRKISAMIEYYRTEADKKFL